MRFVLSTVAIALISIILQIFLPWWAVALAAFVVGLASGLRPGWAFLSGLLGIGLVWFGHAWWLDGQNQSLLSAKIAGILPVGSTLGLLLLTTAVGALVGAFSALTGSLLRPARK